MKKVLIITYYWPPSGGGGVQRWLKFTKYLPEFGWEPYVFTPENPSFNFKDDSLASDVNPSVEVFKLPIWEPYGLFNKLNKSDGKHSGQAIDKVNRNWKDQLAVWVRGNLFIPDPRRFWVRSATGFLKDFLRDNNIEIVVTTGPPHSIHLIGRRLKTSIPNLRWVADFRDPWSEWHQLKHLKTSNWALRIHRRLEKKVLTAADLVLTVNSDLANDFERLGAQKTAVITNGFDLSDYPLEVSSEKPDKFRISHIGTVDDLRDPGPFLEALIEVCKENKNILDDVELHFMGIISTSFLSKYLSEPMLKDKIMLTDYTPHNKIFEEYKRSAVLLLLLSSFGNDKAYMPGKFFEYLGSGRPILGIINPNGQTAEVIEKSNVGYAVSPKDMAGIKKAILALYKDYKTGKAPLKQAQVNKFSRKSLTEELTLVFDSLQK